MDMNPIGPQSRAVKADVLWEAGSKAGAQDMYTSCILRDTNEGENKNAPTVGDHSEPLDVCLIRSLPLQPQL